MGFNKCARSVEIFGGSKSAYENFEIALRYVFDE